LLRNGNLIQKHRHLAVFPFERSTFLQAKKNPPKRVFPKTIIDSLSAAILAMVDRP
jgi:hypothetical protein